MSNIWLITVGEPLPILDNEDRLWRTGLLSKILSDRGHEVLWWASTVDHLRKLYIMENEDRFQTSDNISIQLLHGRLYKKNISFNRLINHAEIARRFSYLSRLESKPDLILCSFPTIELSYEAVKYGQEFGVPVVLDVRDLWPDIFLSVLPKWINWFGRMLLYIYFFKTRYAFNTCHSILGISENYLNWALSLGGRIRCSNNLVYPLGYSVGDWTDSDELSVKSRFERCGLSLYKPTVCFVGSFGRTYDLETVINAAKLLQKREGWMGQIAICGGGEREKEWRDMAEGVSDVGFMGWLSARELSCMLSKSVMGLAAYASQAPQGIPNKIIEYLATGLPMFFSLGGEARDLLQTAQCGIYYRPGDCSSLAESMFAIIKDKSTLDAMSESALKLYNQNFSAHVVYGALANHLENIIEQ
ncbi:MAG: glycosyltransferase family 4 protein [Candidatus Staskawiczbacteria bacterium]|nr:glycosyltransferase family 4 protein [Candidatus Staskawiczbacteria bacterium]